MISLTFSEKIKMDVVAKEIETYRTLSEEFRGELKDLREKRAKVCYTCLFWYRGFYLDLQPLNNNLYGNCKFYKIRMGYGCWCHHHKFREDLKCIDCENMEIHEVYQYPICCRPNGANFIGDKMKVCKEGLELSIKKELSNKWKKEGIEEI